MKRLLFILPVLVLLLGATPATCAPYYIVDGKTGVTETDFPPACGKSATAVGSNIGSNSLSNSAVYH